MTQWFPDGVRDYLLGGLLIGLGVAWIFVSTGIRAGASGVLTATLSFVLRSPTFDAMRSERGWRLVFSAGLVIGAALFTCFHERFMTEVDWWRLAVGGFLVGLGTRACRGCTSGHGICGLGSMNRFSLVHVLVFMAVAIATAQIVRRLS